MLQEIKNYKENIKTKQSQFDKSKKQYEDSIAYLERLMMDQVAKFNESIIADMEDHIYNIQCNVESYQNFKFDGFKIDRCNKNVIIYISDNELIEYEVYLENGEFICDKKIDTVELNENMKRILIALNDMFSNY